MTYYQIYDRQQKVFCLKLYTSLRAALRRADALDMQYGAVRYLVKRVGA